MGGGPTLIPCRLHVRCGSIFSDQKGMSEATVCGRKLEAWPSWEKARADQAWERGSVGSGDRRGSYDYSAVECQCIEYLVVAHSLLIQGVIRDALHVGEVELGSRVMCRRGSTLRR